MIGLLAKIAQESLRRTVLTAFLTTAATAAAAKLIDLAAEKLAEKKQ